MPDIYGVLMKLTKNYYFYYCIDRLVPDLTNFKYSPEPVHCQVA